MYVVETSLLIRASFPLLHWEHAFRCVIHLINRIPSKTLLSKSPYELLYKEKPFYHHLRTFVYLYYLFLRPYNSSKVEPRYITRVFLGYPLPHKGIGAWIMSPNVSI